MTTQSHQKRSPRQKTPIELAWDKRLNALLSLKFRNFGNTETDEFDLADAEYRSLALRLGYPPIN